MVKYQYGKYMVKLLKENEEKKKKIPIKLLVMKIS